MSERQLDVLRWIDDGWPDFTHKTTASALAGRGLAIVRRRAKRWEATITDDWHYYLDHGFYPGQTATESQPPARRRQPAPVLTAKELLAQIEAAGGHLTVYNPPSQLRGAYRRAVGEVIANGLVPEGRVLHQYGRYSGDFRITAGCAS